jgi:hypothetical protein
MQKLVRWGRSLDIEHGDVLLCATFLALVRGPGQFLPALKVYSTGGRLAFQRLAIILVEDSVDPDDVPGISYWGALAAVLQEQRSVQVPDCVLHFAFGVLVRARASS